jgi:SAM-dependent methyltransferase
VAGAERLDCACQGRGLSAGSETLARVGALWGGSDYDNIVPYYAPIYDELVERLAPAAGERFLDVACGTGEIAIRAAQAGADVTGLDVAPAMLDRARAKASSLPIELDLGDAQKLPYDDRAFDVVASNFGVIFAADRDAVAAELARVCRHGGRLGLTAGCPKPALDELYARFGRTSGVEAWQWSQRDELERLLGAAFELVVHERVWYPEGARGADVLAFWSRTAPPTKAYLEALDASTRAEVEAALIEYWEGFRDGDRVREPRAYVLVLGRRR